MKVMRSEQSERISVFVILTYLVFLYLTSSVSLLRLKEFNILNKKSKELGY